MLGKLSIKKIWKIPCIVRPPSSHQHMNKLKNLKSRSRSMVVWMMVRYGWVGGGQNGVVWGVVGSSMDDDVDDGMDGL